MSGYVLRKNVPDSEGVPLVDALTQLQRARELDRTAPTDADIIAKAQRYERIESVRP